MPGMKLQQRKALLVQLGRYLLANGEAWQEQKERAARANAWFIPQFVDLASEQIAQAYLTEATLDALIDKYNLPEENREPKAVGIVMAGNIPLVGFHDLLAVFLTGHRAQIKLSSKDDVLMKHLVEQLVGWEPEAAPYFVLRDLLKNCDAYIATGSNNSSRYFEYYFRNHPTIIRKNRTSVAILDGNETAAELEALADDVFQYFGLGCRNVSKLYVPQGYDFVPLLRAFDKYRDLINHNKYKNNYDYNLAAHILNNRYFMSNEAILLVEDPSPFSPLAQLHYEFYNSPGETRLNTLQNDSIQCVVGREGIPFGQAQCPTVTDYADGVDTIDFLLKL
jgi:hypothetical protein